jgi:hypothetical protein
MEHYPRRPRANAFDRLQQKTRISNEDTVWGDISSHECIRAYPCVLSDLYGADDLSASANVNMSRDLRNSFGGRADSYLLKDKAIATYLSGRVYDNTVWMWNKQPAANN